MDAWWVDLIKSTEQWLAWPIALLIAIKAFRDPIAAWLEKVSATVELPGGISVGLQPGSQIASAGASPEDAARAELETSAGTGRAMPSLEQADPIVQRLSKGWIFERTLRIIFPSQMDLLVEASTSEYVGEKRALELYDRPTDPAVKSRSFQDFIGFLTNSQLLEVIFPSNIIGYAITGRGRQLLEFARQINGGVAWPMVPLDDSLPLETSVPSAES